MFSFNEDDVDFFLPQLLTLYINMHDVAEATHPYIVYRWHCLLIALLFVIIKLVKHKLKVSTGSAGDDDDDDDDVCLLYTSDAADE